MSTNACVVDHPFIAPHYFLSSLSPTISKIQPPTNDFNTFESVDVKVIGRKSVSIFLGGWILVVGTTLAFFQTSGMTPSRKEALNILHNGSASQTELSRRIQFGMFSRSHDLLVII